MTNQELLELMAALSAKIIKLEAECKELEKQRDLWVDIGNDECRKRAELKNEIGKMRADLAKSGQSAKGD